MHVILLIVHYLLYCFLKTAAMVDNGILITVDCGPYSLRTFLENCNLSLCEFFLLYCMDGVWVGCELQDGVCTAAFTSCVEGICVCIYIRTY